MYVLRCTEALRAKLGLAPSEFVQEGVDTSTKLGDWYGNRLNVGAQRFVICTSERSLLTVVVPAKQLRVLPERVRDALALLLHDLGVPVQSVAAELSEMDEVRFGRTRSRQILGSMLDLAWQAEVKLREHPVDLRQVNLDLADVPCSPLKYASPKERALELLAGDERHMLPHSG